MFGDEGIAVVARLIDLYVVAREDEGNSSDLTLVDFGVVSLLLILEEFFLFFSLDLLSCCFFLLYAFFSSALISEIFLFFLGGSCVSLSFCFGSLFFAFRLTFLFCAAHLDLYSTFSVFVLVAIC